MMKKLWCILWGHIVTYDAFTGNYGTITNVMGSQIQVPLVKKCFYTHCPRCGAKIQG